MGTKKLKAVMQNELRSWVESIHQSEQHIIYSPYTLAVYHCCQYHYLGKEKGLGLAYEINSLLRSSKVRRLRTGKVQENARGHEVQVYDKVSDLKGLRVYG